MQAQVQWLRGIGATLLSRPDELMLELGASGELLVARVRALLSALVLLLPLINAASGAPIGETVIGLGAAIATNVMAHVWLALARRRRAYRWLPYATGTYDVTTTTAVLVLLAMGDPVSGMNSMVVWCFYLISIAMTALRHDSRLTLYVGALSILQYGLLVWAIFASAPGPDQLVSVDYGSASVAGQVERLVLLLLMTLLTGTIVYRMQRLVELSGSDGLTGLPNRSWLVQHMPRVLERLRRDGGSLTLALLDLDGFKRINDELGHLNGDRAIRQLAATLQLALQANEHLVRLGGQEFVMLLQSPIGSAWERLDRVRRTQAEQPFVPERGSERYTITFSGGLASWPQDGSDIATLLGSADRRLQIAKRDGRNRIAARDF